MEKTIRKFIKKYNIEMYNLKKVQNNTMLLDGGKNMNNYSLTLGNGQNKFDTYFSKGVGLGDEFPTLEEVLECLALESIDDSVIAVMGEYGIDQSEASALVEHVKYNNVGLCYILGHEGFDELQKIYL